MPRSRRRSSVLRLNQTPQSFKQPRLGGRPSTVGAPQNRPGGDVGGALAPQFSTLGGQSSVLTPNVEAYAPQGGPAAFGGGGGESTALIDMLAAQPGPPVGQPPAPAQYGPEAGYSEPAPYSPEAGYSPVSPSYVDEALGSYQPAPAPTVGWTGPPSPSYVEDALLRLLLGM